MPDEAPVITHYALELATPGESGTYGAFREIWTGVGMVAPDFTAEGGRGLEGLARDLPRRCEEVVRLKGERLPK